MSPRLWLLRHAESEWNAASRWQGRADPPLSARGLEQAAQAAVFVEDALAGARVGGLYCSTLQRAVATARIVGARLDLEPQPVPGLEELDVGRWSGLSTDEIRGREPELLAAFETGDPDVRPGGGETRREMRARVLRAVTALSPTGDADVLAVVHLGVVRALVPGAEPGHVELTATTFAALAQPAEAEPADGATAPL